MSERTGVRAARAGRRGKTPRRGRGRELWLKAHLYLGAGLGLLLAVIGLSGSLLVVIDPVDEALNPGAHRAGGGPRDASAQEAVEAAGARFPGYGEPLGVTFPGEARHGPEETYEVYFHAGDVCSPGCGATGVGSTFDEGYHFVNVDPTTGRVVADRADAWEHLGWFAWDLHAQLFSGNTGLWIVLFGGFALLATALTGLVLWWPLGKNGSGFGVRLGLGGRRLVFDLHNAVGFYASAGLLVVALTGVLVTAPYLPRLRPAVEAAFGVSGTAHHSGGHSTSEYTRGAEPIGADRAAAAVERSVPEGKVQGVDLPTTRDGVYDVSVEVPTDRGRSFTSVAATVDRYTGEVLHVDDGREYPLGRKVLQRWATSLHNGSIAGTPGKAVVFVLGLVPSVLFVTGLLMWRNKRGSRLRARERARSIAHTGR